MVNKDKFKELYLAIAFEHIMIQVFIGLMVVFVWPIVAYTFGGVDLKYAFVFCAFFYLLFKCLGFVIDALKAYWILKRCKEGDAWWLETYREWIGRDYQ